MARSIAYDPKTPTTEGFFFFGTGPSPRGRARSPFSLVFHMEINFIAIYGGFRDRCWIERGGGRKGRGQKKAWSKRRGQKGAWSKRGVVKKGRL
jgi:hypothetical protein